MTKASQNAIHNAEKVIEKFGGIRPMASKTSIPVTTIQGWKKRNTIPGKRLDALLQAAKDHNVDLDDLLEQSREKFLEQSDVANENDQSQNSPAAEISAPPERRTPDSHAAEDETPLPLENNIEAEFASSERKAVALSTFISVALIVLALGALIAILWPKVEQIEKIETEIEVVKEEQSFLRGLIPDSFEQRMESLQEQAKQVQESVGMAVEAAQTISSDVMGADAGSLQERVVRLETHVADLAGGSPQIVAMLQRAQQWRQSLPGQDQLNQSITELNTLITGMGGNSENLTGVLESAREKSPALAQTFEGVPSQELKAAAMLLGLSQFRNTLNRDNVSFEEDMKLLLNLVGEDNIELRASLERLAPHAQEGILTPEGLSAEFRSLTGEIVVSSLKGEDVAVQEKAKARFNTLFQVEKDGELLTGTDTQATLLRTQKLLETGDVEEAIIQVQTLEGPAAETAAPWLDKARITLLAQKARQTATQTINLQAFGDKALAAGRNFLPGNTRLIRNEEADITILKPARPLQQ